MKLIIVERRQPLMLNDSKLNGPDTLGGSTKWNIDLSKDNKDKCQKKQYEKLLHGKDVSCTLKEMRSLLENLLSNL